MAVGQYSLPLTILSRCLVCLFLLSRYSRTVSLLLFKCTVVLLIVEACKFLYSFSPALRRRRKKGGGALEGSRVSERGGWGGVAEQGREVRKEKGEGRPRMGVGGRGGGGEQL